MAAVSAVFRAEASSELGLGHMMRCLALADALELETPPLLVASEVPELERLAVPLTDRGWRVETVSGDDAEHTAAIAKRENADLLVTDLCHRHHLENPGALADYHKALKENGAPLLVSIEDCRMTGLASDIAIVPYNCPLKAYAGNVAEGCRVLEGLGYYIARPEFSAAAKQQREIAADGRRILVAIGGGDPTGLTAKITEALTLLEPATVEARILSARAADIEGICAGRPQLQVRGFSKDVAADLMWADLAVIGEGLVRFEAAMTGTPSLTVSQIEHDSDVLLDFFTKGTTRYIGRGDVLTAPDIATEIAALLGDGAARRKQSEAGKTMIDGDGAGRIANEILSLI